MAKKKVSRLSVTFRVAMLLLATSVLFFAVISINHKIDRSSPETGLLAVEGESFVHVTVESADFVIDQGAEGLLALPPDQILSEQRQVLRSAIGTAERPDGTKLSVGWSLGAEDISPILRYAMVDANGVQQQWEEELSDFSELFDRMERDIGAGGTIQVNYLPSQQSSEGIFRESTFTVQAITVSAEPSYFVRLAAGFMFLAIGFIITFSVASRRLPHGDMFLLLCIGFFIILSFYVGETTAPLLWGVLLIAKVAYLFTPVGLLHFLYLVGEEIDDSMRWRRMAPLYIPSLLLLIGNVIAALRFSLSAEANRLGVLPSFLNDPLHTVVCGIETAVLPVFTVVILLLLLQAFGRTDDLDQKRLVKWLFWGIGIGLLPFAIVNYPLKLTGLSAEVIDLAVSLPLFITPFSFALAVFSFRFIDVEVIFKRGFVYLATSFSLLGVYLILMLGLTRFSGEINTQTLMIISGGMILLATLVSSRIKDHVQQFFDRFLYRDFYDFRKTLQEFSVQLSYERDLERLLEKISDRIENTFSISVVFTFIASAKRENFVLVHSTVETFPVRYIGREDSNLLRAKLLAGAPTYIDQIGDLAAAREMREHKVITLIPFLSLGEVIGFLALGNTEDGDILNSDDLDLLTSLADRAAVSIDNAMLYMDLQTRAEELRELKEFNENIVESVDSGIAAVDVDGVVRSWNSALESLFAVQREEAIGTRLLTLLPDKLANVVEPYLRLESGSERFHNLYKVVVETRDGQHRVLNISFAPLGEETPSVIEQGGKGTVVIVDDITDGVKMEEQLMQQEKMAGLGLLAAGVAHEVNTPLAGIAGYVQMLQKKMAVLGQKEFTTLLEKVEKQAFRASKIINSLLSFSRQSASERIDINFNALVTDSLTLLENQLKYPDVRVTTDLVGDLYTIVGDRTKLQQVMINLLLNARDSMHERGEIRIATRNNGDRIECIISDTGSGIPADVLPKIFDPFFTTKKIGQGTGLGLSVSYGIIQEHKGDIDVESEIEKGTTFTLVLPAKSV